MLLAQDPLWRKLAKRWKKTLDRLSDSAAAHFTRVAEAGTLLGFDGAWRLSHYYSSLLFGVSSTRSPRPVRGSQVAAQPV